MSRLRAPVATAGRVGVLERLRHNLAVQDYACLVFHAYLCLRAAVSPPSHEANVARAFTLALLAMTAVTIGVVRSGALGGSRFAAGLYRIGLFGPMALSYFSLKFLLPGLHVPLRDAALLGIDRSLLGETPAVWLEAFNRPAVIEWFSFFYYSYFTILALMTLSSLAFGRGGRAMRELFVGALTVVGVGTIGYTLVPAVGPHISVAFAGPLHGGFWWDQVRTAVEDAGAAMDVFPSLHTAYPTFFVLHAFAHRREGALRWAWPILAVFCVNIIISTMLLRWHYAIDVVAGLALAAGARWVAVRVARHEAGRGVEDDRQLTWPAWR